MTRDSLRSPSAVPLAIVGAAVLAASHGGTPGLASAVKTVPADVRLADTEAWGMGGSGDPIPSADLTARIARQFIEPNPPFFQGQPEFPVSKITPVFTPEGLYPLTGVKTLPFDTSAAQGVSIINTTITDQIAAGNNLVVVGGSQSATIASLEMRDLLALPADQQPTADQLSFVLLVDPSAPNGGLLERFGDPSLPPLTIPSFGVTFSGATPADTPWDTAVYDMEYDGFSDFPRYPLNLLADLNAGLGIAFVHAKIEHLPDALLRAAVTLPVSDYYTGHTQYFMIPTENLPLLDPLRAVPVVGNPLADLLQPDLKVLVNLGYGQIEHGWDPGPANVATPFELFPTNIDWADVLTALAGGAKQGVEDFVGDLGSLSLPSISEAITAAARGADSLPSLTDIVNGLSGLASAAYGALLPMADAINALLTTLPAYDISLFVQELSAGHLVDAIGMPIAADFGLTPIALGFGLLGLKDVEDAVQALTAGF